MFGLKLFSIALVFLLSLGQLQQVQLWGLSIYFSDLLIVGFVCFELARKAQRQKIISVLRKKYQSHKKILTAAFLLVSLGWLLALATPQWWLGPLHLLRLGVYGMFVYLYAGRGAAAPRQLYTATALLLAAWGLLQYLFLPDLRFIALAGYDDHFYRLTSTLLDPNFAGLIFALALSVYLSHRQLHWPKIALLLIALWLTYSRAAYLAFGLSQLYLIYRGTHRRQLILLLLAFISSLWWLPTQSGGAGVDLTRQASIWARFDKDWAILSDMQPAQMLLGQGLLIPHPHWGFPNSWPVLLLQNVGLLGGALVLLSIWRARRRAKRGQCPEVRRRLNHQQLALTLIFLSFSLFNHSLTQQTSILLYLGLLFTSETPPQSSSQSR